MSSECSKTQLGDSLYDRLEKLPAELRLPIAGYLTQYDWYQFSQDAGRFAQSCCDHQKRHGMACVGDSQLVSSFILLLTVPPDMETLTIGQGAGWWSNPKANCFGPGHFLSVDRSKAEMSHLHTIFHATVPHGSEFLDTSINLKDHYALCRECSRGISLAGHHQYRVIERTREGSCTVEVLERSGLVEQCVRAKSSDNIDNNSKTGGFTDSWPFGYNPSNSKCSPWGKLKTVIHVTKVKQDAKYTSTKTELHTVWDLRYYKPGAQTSFEIWGADKTWVSDMNDHLTGMQVTERSIESLKSPSTVQRPDSSWQQSLF